MTGQKIIVKQHLGQLIHNQGFQTSKDFWDTLETALLDKVMNAVNRAKDNGRTTVMKRDL